jgi:outer membrane receptor protein involved in Fe transport
MTRSRLRKLKRVEAKRARPLLRSVPIASILLAGVPRVFAQQPQPQDASALEEVIVSAQKRDESLQTVPLSIQAIGTQRLEELHVTDFNDYAKFLPSVSFNTTQPGFAQVYMRGVVSGGDGNHSASLPSVGMYLDEQPITTIQGALDIHIYDIARVEALSGPQGTLYGASSQSGTIRIITNKPDPSAFSAAYDLEGNTLSQGNGGYTAEGYVNIPLSPSAAIRLVGWKTYEGGYIDNVARPRTYSTGVTADNTSVAKKNYNPVSTYGARAALRLDLNDTWTITPTLMGQKQTTEGVFATDTSIGQLQVAHQFPENSSDRWGQAALTVEGRFSNFDIVYAGAYLKRNDEVNQDYADYSFFYDVAYGFASYITNNAGQFVDPGQYIQGKDRYKRYSQELRVSSPSDWKVRYVTGLFMQRQEHSIEQRYLINDLADNLSVTGWPHTLWLTEQMRTDRDYAAFGEVTWDVTEKLSLTGGLRFFRAKNSLDGFFGFGINNIYGSSTGEASCTPELGGPFNGAPCTNLRKTTEENNHIHKLNASYRFAEDKMVYVTWSKGFRPGGINRRGSLPPYTSDFLTNYEVGWKTMWLNNRLRFNGAAFVEDWKDFQFSILGGNGLTEIKNANQARIRGIESDLSWAVTGSFRLTAGAALLDSKLTANYCGFVDASGSPETNCPVGSALAPNGPQAPDGQQLPVTPKFKGNLTGRYSFGLGMLNAYVQGAAVYTGSRWADLRTVERNIIGKQPSYTLVDFSAGVARENFTLDLYVNNAFDKRAELFRFAECAEAVCGPEIYSITNQPRTIGVKFGQKF